jgi:hypothetical protein
VWRKFENKMILTPQQQATKLTFFSLIDLKGKNRFPSEVALWSFGWL